MSKYRITYCAPVQFKILEDKEWEVPAVIYHNTKIDGATCSSCFQLFFAPNSWDKVL